LVVIIDDRGDTFLKGVTSWQQLSIAMPFRAWIKITANITTALAELLVWLKPSGEKLFSDHRPKGRCN
jgi:hypothetical protein